MGRKFKLSPLCYSFRNMCSAELLPVCSIFPKMVAMKTGRKYESAIQDAKELFVVNCCEKCHVFVFISVRKFVKFKNITTNALYYSIQFLPL
jgi:hypothetical protein